VPDIRASRENVFAPSQKQEMFLKIIGKSKIIETPIFSSEGYNQYGQNFKNEIEARSQSVTQLGH
jgi:hypothetical protein